MKYVKSVKLWSLWIIPCIFLVFWSVFVSTYYENVIIGDDLNFFAPLIDNLNTSFTFDKLKIPQGYYGLIFYKLSVFLNFEYFSWNTSIFVYGGLVVRCVSVIILLNILQRAFEFNGRYLLILSIIVSIACFSTAKIRTFNYVMIAWYPTFEFIITVIMYRFLYLYLNAKHLFSKHLVVFSICCIVQTFLFSSPTFLINFTSIIIYSYLAIIFAKEKSLILKKIMIYCSLFFAMLVGYYYIFLNSSSRASRLPEMIDKLVQTDLIDLWKYFSYGFMTGLFHTHSQTLIENEMFANFFSINNLPIFGTFAIAIFVVYSLEFFRCRIYQKSIIPFLLILDSFMAIFLTFILRGVPVEIALSPRYGDLFSKGYIGIVVIGVYLLSRINFRSVFQSVQGSAITILLVIFVSVNVSTAYLSLNYYSTFVSRYYDNIVAVYSLDSGVIPENSLKTTLFCNKPIVTCRQLVEMVKNVQK